ncbi:hypothetical protein K461DRAFT_311920 [Myriangium duriaei CBS 260.36]|uniref:Uncharacterized protein n=1 Tax=Myriangium duriaei CBS 260.36 TaxID=1168546 RepID=A0A9P4J1S2_9PEZI|nr:hypothetical protein K461DRAFT_311920 [Myriangium duriaei CBS 260.36]
MVRSNFDYTNRTSSGEKLGASIASDFWKKAAQVIKPVKAPIKSTKTAAKAAKLTQSDTPPPVKSVSQTKLDIKIPDKALTDAGFQPIAEAVVAALKARPDLTLTELNLSGNELTYKSFDGLARIMRQSPELVSLNLSNNQVSIKTEEAVSEWEKFADAYWSSPRMNRLDLSDNKDLGGPAFESLARISASQMVDASIRRDSHHFDSVAEMDISSTTRRAEQLKENLSDHNNIDDGALSDPVGSSPISDKSVEYGRSRIIALKSVGLDEHAILFASAIILRTSDSADAVRIEWGGKTDLLSRDGALLLDLAANYQCVRLNTRRMDALNNSFDMGQDPDSIVVDQRNSPHSHRDLGNLDIDEGALLDEIERTTKKIERNVIVRRGHVSIELWAAAMHVLTISRKVYILAASLGSGTALRFTSPAKPVVLSRSDFNPRYMDWSEQALRQTKSWGNGSPKSATVGKHGVIHVSGFTNSIRDITISRAPNRPAVHCGNSIGQVNDYPRAKILRVTNEPSKSESPFRTGARHVGGNYLDWQKKRLGSLHNAHGGASNGYRDPSLKCQLPLPVCNRILSLSASDRSLMLLSRRQQIKVFEWGQLHDSLKTESDWTSRDKASQIWMLLEALECLKYDYEV